MNCFDCATELDSTRSAFAECAACGAAVCADHAVGASTRQPVGLIPRPVSVSARQPVGLIPQPTSAPAVTCRTCASRVAGQSVVAVTDLDFAARIRADAPGRRERVAV